ncbi:MAG TPA: hypothetical protein VL084_15210 [Thermoanaerobaculia bacterium]|nr:hypothetical protein [Thermoanaerobaculia bacterium]
MRNPFRRLATVFGAGAFGGLANSLTVWLAGQIGLTGALGVKLAPALTPAWLYPRIVWGGLWGLLFLLPVRRLSPVAQGLLLSIGPTLVQLFVVFPYRTPAGTAGLGLGSLTPVLVVFFNAVWGLAAAWWVRRAE